VFRPIAASFFDAIKRKNQAHALAKMEKVYLVAVNLTANENETTISDHNKDNTAARNEALCSYESAHGKNQLKEKLLLPLSIFYEPT
jgi:hypothetical protein